MWVRALKTFNGRYGKIRAGEKFNAEPGYVAQLNRRKGYQMVEVVSDTEQPQLEAVEVTGADPGPSNDRNKGDAPGRAGKDNPGDQGRTPGGQGQAPAGGKGITSQSLPAVPASRARIAKPSRHGGRRGKPTPRKAKQKPAAVTTQAPQGQPPADA